MKRISILLMFCVMALVFVPTSAYATGDDLDIFGKSLEAAVAKVQANSEFEDARLHEAHWVLDDEKTDFETIEVIFDGGKEARGATIFLEGTKKGESVEFEDPELILGKWEDEVIEIPKDGKFNYSVGEARKMLEKELAKFKRHHPDYDEFYLPEIDTISLDHPYDKQNYPYFIFGDSIRSRSTDDEGLYIAVSVNPEDHKVLAEEELGYPRESGYGEPLVKIGTQCASRIKDHRFSGGKWMKGKSAVICKKNPPSNIKRIRVTESVCRVNDGKLYGDFNVYKLGRSCRKELTQE
ncbi:MAG: hypothetical protein AAGD25_26280 [Cyanobacteria bacterium P01_F01_bin.150]